jgi:parallel beta-helix repeat protein
VLIKALKEGKPVADDGRTYDTIQQAERAANGWVFVPPGTFTESINVTTDGLTLTGAGVGTNIDGGSDFAVSLGNNCTLRNVQVSNSSDRAISIGGHNCLVENIVANSVDTVVNGQPDTDNAVIRSVFSDGASSQAMLLFDHGDGYVISNNTILNSGSDSIVLNDSNNNGDNAILSNNIVKGASGDGIVIGTCDDIIIIGNRVHNSTGYGVRNKNGVDCIIANNRASNNTNGDIQDAGSGTVLDSNLSGSAN